MKKLLAISLIFTAAILGISAIAHAESSDDFFLFEEELDTGAVHTIPGEILVQLNQEGNPKELIQALGVKVDSVEEIHPRQSTSDIDQEFYSTYKVKLSSGENSEWTASELSKNRKVAYAEPNYTATAIYAPEDSSGKEAVYAYNWTYIE
jgi:hypothetical protein